MVSDSSFKQYILHRIEQLEKEIKELKELVQTDKKKSKSSQKEFCDQKARQLGREYYKRLVEKK